MSEVYIISAVRTPVGVGKTQGALSPIAPVDLVPAGRHFAAAFKLHSSRTHVKVRMNGPVEYTETTAVAAQSRKLVAQVVV